MVNHSSHEGSHHDLKLNIQVSVIERQKRITGNPISVRARGAKKSKVLLVFTKLEYLILNHHTHLKCDAGQLPALFDNAMAASPTATQSLIHAACGSR
jgi:hypothetical protein